MTGPVQRFAGQIASHGYVVGETVASWCQIPVRLTTTTYRLCLACPSSFHEFEGPEPIPYDVEGPCVSFHIMRTDRLTLALCFIGTDRGNKYKVMLDHLSLPLVKSHRIP